MIVAKHDGSLAHAVPVPWPFRCCLGGRCCLPALVVYCTGFNSWESRHFTRLRISVHPPGFVAGFNKSGNPFVMQDIRKEAPSQKVLDTAKAQTLNSFVFNFASTNTQLQRILIYSLLGLPQDYLFQYKTGIEQVTSEDVRNAALRHLHPEQQIVVVAADRDSFEAPLKQRFGEVESLSIDN